MDEVMTPEQVAEYLRLRSDEVYDLIRCGELAAPYTDRTYRIHQEDIESFLEHSTRPEAREARFALANAIAERNPSVNSDDVLEELERHDELRKRKARSS